MANSIEPRLGPRRFQWNAGGWWGSAIGCVAWMGMTGCILIGNNQVQLGLLLIALLVSELGLATYLWLRRDRVLPFRAYMMLLGSLAVATPVAIFALASWGSESSLARLHWDESAVPNAAWFFIAPALMLLFFCLEHTHPEQSDLSKRTIGNDPA